MRYLLSLLLMLVVPTIAHAMDLTTNTLVVSGYATSKVTSAPFERKLMLAAQDDAAMFVASGGTLRGARLEAALMHLRQANPQFHADDLELAQAILIQ
ncbi:Holliday junction resolvase [Pseudomonas sp. SDI]|uniref:DUF2388 domain-containing protein n=1 Tax=Pseudomonas sp. SDI TaxID=2170734 RepID=UPI000DE71AF7|nr:DUF2388 domain-containing protein [Pseudomonas sp. SDI]PWB29734.1 Holliday junction resolvase [Pseudomonas sp. SDI]